MRRERCCGRMWFGVWCGAMASSIPCRADERALAAGWFRVMMSWVRCLPREETSVDDDDDDG